MTQYAQKFIQKQNIVSTLQLAEQIPGGGVKGTGPHIVKMIRDEIGKNKDYMTGEMVDGLWFYVEEAGQQLKYFVPFKDKKGEPHYLIERLAPVKEGDIITLEYLRRGTKGYINVRLAEPQPEEPQKTERPSLSPGYWKQPEIPQDEIPIIEN